MRDMTYQSGFGNQFASARRSRARCLSRPQQPAAAWRFGLYAELLSGSAFTAPRADNRRTWFYRRRPSVVVHRHGLPAAGAAR